VILAYHDVGDDPRNDTDCYVSPKRLRMHLTSSLRWGLRFVDLAELVSSATEGADLDGLGAVVFDDSLVGVHHHAMPILLELGLPATVFTVSGALGRTPPWWEGAARVMTRAELEEMAAAGFRISSHSRTHPSLPTVPPDRLEDELTGSRHELEDLIGTDVDLFAYPFGHYDPGVVRGVAEAGYRAAFSFLNGRVVPGLERFRLPRMTMWKQSRPRLAYHLARPAGSWPDNQLRTVTG
jgi:peptidoglycan/xylan/chitin deacetylase (PgdA/CDA1 family)